MKFLGTKRFWKKLVIVIVWLTVIASVSVYFLLAPRFNDGFVNSVLFHPYTLDEHNPDLRTLSGVTAEELSIPSSDANLNALFYSVPGSPDVVLLSHGNAGNIDNRIDKIRAIVDAGVSVLAYDYCGYGKSAGKPTLRGVIEDGLASYDYLIKQKNYKPENILLYGESVGTGVTTEMARKRSCKAMILESGFTSPERIGKERVAILRIYPSFLMPDPALDNLDYVRGKHPPLLLFAGKMDEVIPCHHSETMFAEATPPKKLVLGPNSTHNDFSRDFEMYRSALTDFLHEHANGGKRVRSDGKSDKQD